MQLVVEISEDTFFDLKRKQNRTEVDNAVLKGTPLPKGHGRLIDADKTLKKHCAELCREKPSCHEDCLIYDLFHLALTIVEADKGEQE